MPHHLRVPPVVPMEVQTEIGWDHPQLLEAKGPGGCEGPSTHTRAQDPALQGQGLWANLCPCHSSLPACPPSCGHSEDSPGCGDQGEGKGPWAVSQRRSPR